MLTVLCGIPGSGKTTWRLRNRPDDLVVCSDDIREELTGDPRRQERNSQVFALARARVDAALARGQDVVVDATNVTRDARRQWIKLAANHDTPCRCVWIECSLEQALRNNAGRDRRVPEDVIRAMANEFAPPCVEEGFVEVARVRNGSRGDQRHERSAT
jgi:predicted kinase